MTDSAFMKTFTRTSDEIDTGSNRDVVITNNACVIVYILTFIKIEQMTSVIYCTIDFQYLTLSILLISLE